MKMSMKNFAIFFMFILTTVITFLLSHEMLRIILFPTKSVTFIWIQVLAFITWTFILLMYAAMIILLFRLATNQI